MKKYEGVKALAFVSIISAICLILILMTHFTGSVGIILLLTLPLCASLVSLSVNKRYILTYVVATLLMSIIDIQLALFVVLPSLLSGTLFGILIKRFIHGYYIIIINSLFQLLLEVGAIYLVRTIYNVDIIKTISTIIKLDDNDFHQISFLFIFLISLIETTLSYLIISNELKKISFSFNEKNDSFMPILIMNIVLLSLSISFFFINKLISYLTLGIYLYFAVILGYYIFSFHEKKAMLITQCGLYIISLIITLIVSSFIDITYFPLLLFIIPGSEILSSIYIIIKCLISKRRLSDATAFQTILKEN